MALPTLPRRRGLTWSAALTLLVLPFLVLTPTSTAFADGPGVGSPWIVSVGDSYISGEAGRWAGNTNNGESVHDALGSTAYFDNATNSAEQINRCHRSKSAEIFIGSGVNSLNLACSGAKTATFTDGSNFKPGLDFYNNSGKQGQARMLQDFAASHNVKMVVASIGGNDFGFADIVTQCVLDFLGSPTWWKDYCKDDSVVTSAMSTSSVNARRSAIAGAFQNIRQAMRNAGYADSAWTLVVSNYMSPLPNSNGFRYSESGYSRHSTGGCGFWNADANYANGTLLPKINQTIAEAVTASGVSGAKILNLSSAFNGRRLCENTVGLYEEKGLSSWTSPGAVDKTEWINTIRTVTATGNYYIQESLHPNFWGQKALRNCVRQVWNGGSVRGGTCVRSGNGLNAVGEPLMSLQ